ncbi:MAG: hypothetical protein IJL98_09690 [Lachnospiraceae bacterium]|nr:hypothetical protein [Lachnospiraceae bacterium]
MKKAAVLFTVLLLLLSFTGCMSPLAKSMELERKLNQVTELDLDQIFSEEEGFHYPGVSWGRSIKEVREIVGAPLDNVAGYAENGDIIYSGLGFKVSLLNVTDDQTTAAVTHEGLCYMISLMYMDDENTVREMKLKDLYDQVKEKLTERFGEAEETKGTHSVGNVATTTVIVDWSHTDKNGRTTHLQMATAQLAGSQEPSFFSLGFVWDLERQTETHEETR